MELKTDATTGMVYRENTLDEYVIKEVTRCYAHLVVKPDDIVLDLGGNIGVSARFFSNVAKKVITIEPEAENFDILMRNIMGCDNVEPIQAAVVGDDRETVRLFLNGEKNKGSHSLVVSGGRDFVEVPTRNFEEIIFEYAPTVIKMDIEGSEYELLQSCELTGVRAMAVEFHLTRKDYKAALPKVRDFLAAQGFRETIPFTFTENAWHKIAFYER
jgi:FkbM family methyltransferase